MCLSSGRPPLPVSNQYAKCGPLVPGAAPPLSGKSLEDLNPCPLNACCSSSNQCGTSVEYCVKTQSTTGAPGTTGCISNCGRDIVNNQVRPATFMSVGYFQPLSSRRTCLVKDIAQINTTQYTHIHYAFATLKDDFTIAVNDYPDQWAKFLQLQGVKRIVSFGAGSVGDAIFRQGVTNTNISGFANKLISFINQVPQLDGIEFDWEFPKTEQEGARYGLLIALVKAGLSDKIVSVALPSGFWNLRYYPANTIGALVDYAVYMTYDMHGIWNYGENYPESSGCPQGKCVRSHVNMTETMDSLISITKAGVQASKIVVGLASYGRSFELAVPGCLGPNCQFTDKNAKLGRCLGTGSEGILAIGEIEEIVNSNQPGTKNLYDQKSDSKILIYDNNQWVAYMDAEIKARRMARYRGLNFAGVVDWSIDQQGSI